MKQGPAHVLLISKGQEIEISPWLYPIHKPAIMKNCKKIKLHAYQIQTYCFSIIYTYNKILLRRNHAGAMLAGSNLTVRTVLSQMIRLVVSLDSTSITARVMMTEIQNNIDLRKQNEVGCTYSYLKFSRSQLIYYFCKNYDSQYISTFMIKYK